jgi:cyclic pyranopterin phosphate synthase
MPEEGVAFLPHEEIIRFEELEQIIRVLVHAGIEKIRITGGEPFVRKGLLPFLQRITKNQKVKVHLTTNGVQTGKYIEELQRMHIAGINLSLDTLQPEKFHRITRRNFFDLVWNTFNKILEAGIPLKINSVIQKGLNDDEIVNLALLAKEFPLHIRFIEQMPFNGKSSFSREKIMLGDEILERIRQSFPSLKKESSGSSTAEIFSIEGFKGKIGIIRGYERAFCASCNRIRITSTGILKNCLYDNGVLDLKQFIRQHDPSDAELYDAIAQAVGRKHQDGHIAEMRSNLTHKQSMSIIGG